MTGCRVSHAAVCRAVTAVSDTIQRKLFTRPLRFPDRKDTAGVMHDAFQVGKFPGVTGCIDCNYVRIKSPAGCYTAEAFRNRKGYFSINVQVSDSWFG